MDGGVDKWIRHFHVPLFISHAHKNFNVYCCRLLFCFFHYAVTRLVASLLNRHSLKTISEKPLRFALS